MAIQNNDPSEEQLQAKCYQWFHNSFPALRGLLFHIPNGGNRSMREGAAFKAIGVIAGVPDLMLCVPANIRTETKIIGGYAINYSMKHGLFIEMKAKGGKLSEAQVKAHARFRNAGYEVLTVNNFSDFEKIIRNWLSYSPYDRTSSLPIPPLDRTLPYK